MAPPLSTTGTSDTNHTDITTSHYTTNHNDVRKTAVDSDPTTSKMSANATTKPSPPSAEYVLNFAFYSFVGFICIQAGFAIMANSQSMLADCEAMAVDAMTYLFNLCAERIKNQPLTDAELQLTTEQRTVRREVRRLWLELVPPTISVTCLIVIVILTTQEAFTDLWGDRAPTAGADADDDDVSVPIMLIFSAANLLLDFVNVACFAKSGASFGLQMMREEQAELRASLRGLADSEVAALVSSTVAMDDAETGEATSYGATGTATTTLASSSSLSSSSVPLSVRHRSKTAVNLNMCSAWTHVCADTMRSISVLIAAGISTLFPVVPGALSDSLAAIAVSFIILISLFPLIQGLIITAIQLFKVKRDCKDLLR